MIKKPAAIFLLITLLAMISSCTKDTQDSIIGEWISASRTKGGLGTSKSYQSDGTLIVAFGALVDFSYKLEENILSLYGTDGNLVAKKQVSYIGDDIILKNIATNKEERLTRTAGASDETILGKWKGVHYTGGKQVLHFTASGNCYLSVPFMSAIGHYQINNHILIEKIKGKEPSEWKWRFEGRNLILEKHDGSKTETYVMKSNA
ncbi:hypothetical protein [endosymbiont of Lamellibrachia barhami]|uniref:hypothetical protein n=1 Tax=endosymbiont of Lamellibrachia barhami TaxID=205975 RepID=UPI0015B31F0B|nr:hypothetical protein [endosymbiont of Lamellibrachia barhami]